MNKEDLIKHLKEATQVLKNPSIENAFMVIDRVDFVDEDYKVEAYEDYPLPIGNGQTISQPTTVAFMLELLDVKKGEKVLDLGSGSGYTSALIGKIVGDSGRVVGVEIITELVEKSRENLAKYTMDNVEIFGAIDEIGFPDEAPYDKILVSASAEELPEGLLEQLKIGGILVIPIGDTIYKIIKNGEREFEDISFSGFSFVPLLVSKNS